MTTTTSAPTRPGSQGATLVELMVAISILSVGILGFFGSFQFITKSIHISRIRTISTNLAQEKIENLKNLSYYTLLITTAPGVDSNFSPPITYDTASYAPEVIDIAGIKFTRYTYVSLAQVDNNVISTVSYTYPDTGMKQMTVYVTWLQDNVRRKWGLSNLLENPNVNSLDASISGTISKAAGGALPGAVVKVMENPDWNATADSGGGYTFRVYHGSYTIRSSSAGFYDSTSAITEASRGGGATVNLSLTAIASGTINGNAWLNTGLVISQVCVATQTATPDNASVQVEYIELFNHTTYPINIGVTGGPKETWINFYGESGQGQDKADTDFDFTHVSTYVPPFKYYLIANASSFVVLGTWKTADAHYYNGASYKNYLINDRSGTFMLLRASDGALIDTVGWCDDDSPCQSRAWEGKAIPDPGSLADGMGEGNQIVRISSPGLVSDAYGRAYDSDNNQTDFYYPSTATFSGIVYEPFSTADSTFTVLTGKPAVGALIAASDPYSGSTRTYAATFSIGSWVYQYAPFSLVGVTTGTWVVEIASGSYYKELSGTGLAVTAQGNTGVPNATTTPSWILANHYALKIDSSTSNGFIEGRVTDIAGAGISGIQILAAGASKTTGSNGNYFASVTSGPITVIVNPNNANSAYTESLAEPTLEAGQVLTQNFTLTKGGSLRGYLTTGTSPLPSFSVTANIGGNQYGAGASDSSGYFAIKNLSTATYTVQPVLVPGQDANPNSITGTVSSTVTIFIGTFTVTGALGTLRGNITNAGESVTSGALILASTATISTTPPAIAASSAPAQTAIYAVSSRADGTYELQVRGGSTPYYVSIYIPVISGTTVSITTKTYSGITVSAGGSTTQNLAIP